MGTNSVMSAVWLREPDGPSVLMLVAHVLALDPASWRIVLGELDADAVDETLGILLKNQEDMQAIRGERLQAILGRALARAATGT